MPGKANPRVRGPGQPCRHELSDDQTLLNDHLPRPAGRHRRPDADALVLTLAVRELTSVLHVRLVLSCA